MTTGTEIESRTGSGDALRPKRRINDQSLAFDHLIVCVPQCQDSQSEPSKERASSGMRPFASAMYLSYLDQRYPRVGLEPIDIQGDQVWHWEATNGLHNIIGIRTSQHAPDRAPYGSSQ